MSFPLYNFPLIQKRTGCTPLRGIVFLLKKIIIIIDWLKIMVAHHLLSPSCGEHSPHTLPDLPPLLDGGTLPARHTPSPHGVTEGAADTLSYSCSKFVV
ncbi:hypothetical protein HanPI659440_Chr07g0266411 [Helianthus annuus]|nr:hypothetical protein HanPI659440_Chr07g0266411 [Helianthus annuus]